MRALLARVLPCGLIVACAAGGDLPDPAWSGAVQVHGALRAMFHQGQTGAAVSLAELLPQAELFAVGALADLAGEVTVIAGQAWLSYPVGAHDTRTEVSPTSDAGAALLVSAQVSTWRSVTIPESIPFDELDDALARLATAAGLNLEHPFPFLLDGEFEELHWHVIDGTRLSAADTTHQSHVAAAVKRKARRTPARLVGFFSRHHQGVFTHLGSATHVHCVLTEPLSSGHVDHVVLPAGTVLRLPAP